MGNFSADRKESLNLNILVSRERRLGAIQGKVDVRCSISGVEEVVQDIVDCFGDFCVGTVGDFGLGERIALRSLITLSVCACNAVTVRSSAVTWLLIVVNWRLAEWTIFCC